MPLPAVLADAVPAALLALRVDPAVLADTRPATVFTARRLPGMLTDPRPTKSLRIDLFL